MITKHHAGVLLAALLTGCASMAPPYERPAPPVAPSFSDAAAVPAEGSATPEWREFFGDARLLRLIEIALADNRDLRAAAAAVEQARAQHGLRRADQWPTLNASVTGSRQTNSSGDTVSSYSAGLIVPAYELDLFGRLRDLTDAARARYLGSEEARRATQIALIGAVVNTDLALRADEALLAVTRQTVETRAESLRLMRLMFDHGATSELDLRQAESLHAAAEAALAQLTRQRALDENALVLLLGRPLPADLPPGQSITEADTGLPALTAGLPSEVLTRRPDVRAAEQALMAANADIGAARAAFFPRITLTGSAGSVSNELSGLFRGGSFGWSFAPQLLQPIFDAGRNRANLDAAKAGRELALAQYERAIQSAFREVADALAGRATLGEQRRAAEAQLEAEAARARLADLRYRGGASSFLELLDAQRSLYAAQQAVVQVQALQAQNLVTLYQVLGGGWDEAQATR